MRLSPKNCMHTNWCYTYTQTYTHTHAYEGPFSKHGICDKLSVLVILQCEQEKVQLFAPHIPFIWMAQQKWSDSAAVAGTFSCESPLPTGGPLEYIRAHRHHHHKTPSTWDMSGNVSTCNKARLWIAAHRTYKKRITLIYLVSTASYIFTLSAHQLRC